MGKFFLRIEERNPRVGENTPSTWIVALLIITVAAFGLDSVSSADFTGTWQHVSPNGQTTLRVEDGMVQVHVIVEGRKLLPFDEIRFVADGEERQSGKRLVTCRRDADSLQTAFRRIAKKKTDDGTIDVITWSRTIVWSLTDDSTLTLALSGSQGQSQMVTRDYEFTRRNGDLITVFGTSEEEEEK